MEQRIAALEKGLEQLDSKLDKLTERVRDASLKNIERLSGIETRLVAIERTVAAKASTADLREISGRIASIPTTWQTIAAMLVGIAGGAFTIAKVIHPRRYGVASFTAASAAARPALAA